MAIAASLIAHLTLIVPALVGVMTADHVSGLSVSKIDPSDVREDPPDEPEDHLELGVDAPNPSSFTWIGYEEYERHLAALAAVEQAAFIDEPIAAAPRPTQAALDADPAHDGTEGLEPTSVEPAAPPPARVDMTTPGEALVDFSAFVGSLAAAARSRSEDMGSSDQGRTESSRETWDTTALTDLFDRAAAHARQAASKAQPARQNPPQDAVAPQPTAGETAVGSPADRESDPSSIVEVPREQWQLGKPLAAHGLEVRPRRPTLTILTTLTAWPRNPLCQIAFDGAGVPKEARILESTGDGRVDAAIEASLYRWRAAGERLEALREGETIDLTIRLLINPQRQPR